MSKSVVITLRSPIQFGEGSDPITVLELRPVAKAFRDLSLPMKDDGTVLFKPYELALVGMKMAAQPPAVLDKMDPLDMMEVATAVMGFLGTSPKTGTTPSES